ncbi:hypothetical protein [Paraburkholderia xenovorans]|uniref:hypothetical protein n=1 Tax=Paraburkholderia xenovorans TaxID=36873 RepID=UPI0015C52953|nr:hypothetical protein [Paraburkholderia xenovorans]NPT32901.1 hypothetical protein [Paraburkholderia xenovorans]
MSEPIATHLLLDRHFSRSISLERDLHDKDALDGYMLTPAVISALTQIGTGVKTQGKQRAWKIIGPYGSGKSALALLLSRLLAGPKAARNVFGALSERAPHVAALFRPGSNLLPLAVGGSRTSLGSAIAKSAKEALRTWTDHRGATKVVKAIDLEQGTYKGQRLNSAASSLILDVISCAQEQGYGGVLLLIDELGKFVEHATLWPAEGDLMVLQQVAELACRGDDASLFVVTMLHQHLADYAKGVGRTASDEWHKISGRFDEVPFDEPVQRYAHFAAHALAAPASVTNVLSIRRTARANYKRALTLGVLRSSGESDNELLEHAERLFPLHPVVLAAMAYVSKRMGQSERSFHAFLRGHEPYAFRDFIQTRTLDAKNWYSSEQLFSFLSQGARLRFRDLATERRWEFALGAIEDAGERSEIEVAVLQALSVLELMRGSARLAATPDLIAFALADKFPVADIQAALDESCKRCVLLKAPGGEGYAFAVNESVNVDALYEVAGDSASDLTVAGLQKLLSENTVVASGHYHRKGTLRTVSINVGQAVDDFPNYSSDADGLINVILVDESRSEHRKRAMALQSTKGRPLVLWTSVELSESALTSLRELSRWMSVKAATQNGTLDPWTSRYVDNSLADVRRRVEADVMSRLLGQSDYFYEGEPVPSPTQLNVSQAASWMFDAVFADCPTLVNELINKDRPSSAIVLARQKLFEKLMATNGPSQALFGTTEFPPERLLYATLLRDTGIYSERANAPWSTPESLKHVWQRVETLLRTAMPTSFRTILKQLSLPPLGIRQGVSSVWVVSYLLAKRDVCAVFERGTLVLELTADHLARMFKNPDAFQLREFSDAGYGEKLQHQYCSVLASVGQSLSAAPTFLELSRAMVRWYARLPEYAQETLSVSADAKLLRSTLKRATDPIELLSQQIPSLFNQQEGAKDFVRRLSSAMNELGSAYRRLQEDAAATLGRAFGIPGPLAVVRTQLQRECADLAADLADVELKAFMLRCVDVTPVDDRWLDSLATLIVKRPMESWADDSLPTFRDVILELCGRYKRWLKVAMERGQHREAGERFLSFTITSFGGEERSLLVASSKKAKDLADKILTSLKPQVSGDAEMLQAALAQALAEVLQANEMRIGAEIDGRKKAS